MAGARLHAQAKAMKEQLIAAKGIQDLAPFMVVLTDDDETVFGHCGPEMEQALGDGVRMGDILAASVMTLRTGLHGTPLKRMMLVVEGYSRAMTTTGRTAEEARERAQAIEHGDLAKDYADNPDSDVCEVLMTNIWNYQNGSIRFQLWCSPFHYTDGGVIVWGEDMGPLGDETQETGVEGAIAEAGRKVMR
jgi:hypothetical protein